MRTHKWGPWISNPKAFNGDPYRICTCGQIHWLGEPDPHSREPNSQSVPRP